MVSRNHQSPGLQFRCGGHQVVLGAPAPRWDRGLGSANTEIVNCSPGLALGVGGGTGPGMPGCTRPARGAPSPRSPSSSFLGCLEDVWAALSLPCRSPAPFLSLSPSWCKRQATPWCCLGRPIGCWRQSCVVFDRWKHVVPSFIWVLTRSDIQSRQR